MLWNLDPQEMSMLIWCLMITVGGIAILIMKAIHQQEWEENMILRERCSACGKNFMETGVFKKCSFHSARPRKKLWAVK